MKSSLQLPGPITIIDFEATGPIPNSARATEIGIVAWDESFNEVARYQTLIRPPFKPGKKAQEVSGITETMIAQARPFGDYWPDIAPFLDGRILVAYNSSYDMQVLANELSAIHIQAYPPVVCAYRMASRLFPKEMAGDLKLPSLTTHFGIQHEAHEALGDVVATGELLKIMLNIAPHELARFTEASQRIERVARPTRRAAKPLLRSDVWEKAPGELNSNFKSKQEQAIRGNITLKEIAKKMLSGDKPCIALTGTPSTGKERFAEQAKGVGFEYSRNPVGKKVTALLVIGIEETGQTKIFDAQEKGVPIVNDAEWQELIKILKEMRNA